MIKRKDLPLFSLIFGCAILFSATDTAAQPEERPPLKIKSISKPVDKPAVNKKPEKINRKNNSSALLKLTAPKRTKVVTDTTSDLTIITEPNARVTMILQGGRGAAKPIVKTATGGEAEFENLKPGRYAISATLNDFIEEQSVVDIPARQSYKLDFPLEPVEYQLNIETNISEGEIRYAPAALVGRNPNGSLKLEPEGDYCIVQIKNNKAKIRGLRKQHYTIDVTPSPTALQYEPVKAAIEPDDIVDREEETEVSKVVEIDLDTKISRDSFAPAWTSGEWKMPPGWKLENKMSTAGSKGAALPQNDLYRYYINFEMRSTVRSLDGKSVGFALRAVDENNYYLVQISGGKAAERYRVTGYVVRDGVIKQQLNSYDISHLDDVINDRKWFSVIIKSKGNVFEIFMEKRGVPQPVPLGNIIDGFENFKKGAVGIADFNNSNFEVGFFTVCPASCEK